MLRSIKIIGLVCLLVCAAMLLAKCGGGGGGDAGSGGQAASIASITVTPTNPTLTNSNTLQLTATAKDGNGNVIQGVQFVWSSSNTAVATLDANGLVTGVNIGTTSITVSSSGITSTPITLTNTIPPVSTPPTFTLVPVPNLTVGTKIEPPLPLVSNPRGGTPPYHYQSDTFANGTTPLGTIIDLNGNLTGTPSASGSFAFGVCIVDVVGASSCQQTTVTVQKAPPTPDSTVTMKITDSCSDGYSINYKFFDGTNNLVWPSSTTHWYVNDGLTDTRTLSCVSGSTICYGANTGSTSWGVGIDNSNSCSNCCYTCDSGTHSVNLSCSGGGGGSCASYNLTCGETRNGVTVIGWPIPVSCLPCPAGMRPGGRDNITPGGPYEQCVCPGY